MQIIINKRNIVTVDDSGNYVQHQKDLSRPIKEYFADHEKCLQSFKLNWPTKFQRVGNFEVAVKCDGKRKTKVTIFVDGFKFSGESICNLKAGDVFNRKFGVKTATQRAVEKIFVGLLR